MNAPPPLHRLDESEEENEVVQLTAYLDRSKPLSEPKWVKTGQLDEWIQSISGTSSSAHARKSNPEFSVWDGKLEVIDPDSVSSNKTPDWCFLLNVYFIPSASYN